MRSRPHSESTLSPSSSPVDAASTAGPIAVRRLPRVSVEQAAGAVADADHEAVSARNSTTERWAQVATDAERVGLAESVRRHQQTAALPGVLGELDVRTDRLGQLRSLHGVFRSAEKAADESGRKVLRRTAAADKAAATEAASLPQLESIVDERRAAIREWTAGTTVLHATEEQVETWCDLVAELTVDDTVAPTPEVDARRHVAAVGDTLRREQSDLRSAGAPLVVEFEDLTARRIDLEQRIEEPPPPPRLWQRRVRPPAADAVGAPLWRCVGPVESLTDDELSRLEATMAAAGLLDAWLTPTGKRRNRPAACPQRSFVRCWQGSGGTAPDPPLSAGTPGWPPTGPGESAR